MDVLGRLQHIRVIPAGVVIEPVPLPDRPDYPDRPPDFIRGVRPDSPQGTPEVLPRHRCEQGMIVIRHDDERQQPGRPLPTEMGQAPDDDLGRRPAQDRPPPLGTFGDEIHLPPAPRTGRPAGGSSPVIPPAMPLILRPVVGGGSARRSNVTIEIEEAYPPADPSESGSGDGAPSYNRRGTPASREKRRHRPRISATRPRRAGPGHAVGEACRRRSSRRRPGSPGRPRPPSPGRPGRRRRDGLRGR